MFRSLSQSMRKIMVGVSVIAILFTNLTVFAGPEGGDPPPPPDETYDEEMNVLFADNDDNAGLDGRDITASWTKLTTKTPSEPAGFANYKLYVLPSGMLINSATSFAEMCQGPCTPLATIESFDTVTTTLGSGVTTDSAGNAFSSQTPTQACIVVTATSPTYDCSLGETLDADVPLQTGVSSLVLSDTDTTGFGLDGRDVKLTWTVTGEEPIGFSQRWLYVLPQSAIDPVRTGTKDLMMNACLEGEQAVGCEAVGEISSFTTATYTLVPSRITDSDLTAWSAETSYGFCILTAIGQSEGANCTGADEGVSIVADAPTDTSAPFINFMPSQFSRAMSDFVVYANIVDEQTSSAAFNNTSDGGNELFQLCHGADVSEEETTCTPAVQVAGNLFSFTVTDYQGEDWPTDRTFEYYLMGGDGADPSNVNYFCNTPDAISTKEGCQANPFVATISVSANYSVSGTVKNSAGTGLSGRPVFIGGFPASHVLTDQVGNFTISGLPKGYGFEVITTDGVSCPVGQFVTINPGIEGVLIAKNVTGLILTVSDAPCGSSESAPPVVVATVPPEGAVGVPTNQNVAIQFSQPMDPGTIVDNVVIPGDNVTVTSDGGETVVGGSVQYCADLSTSLNCASVANVDASMTNYILFVPTQGSVSANTTHEVIVTAAVTSAAGQPTPTTFRFTTAGSVDPEAITDNFGDSGLYMPPVVRAFIPRPGSTVPVNAKLIVVFDKVVDLSTINTTNIKLLKDGEAVSIEVGIDASHKTVKIHPGTLANPVALTANSEYEIRVLGGVTSDSGVSLRPAANALDVAFSTNFHTSAITDSTGPTLTSLIAAGSLVPVNQGVFEFVANENLDPNFVNSSTVSLYKGNTAVSAKVDFDPMSNTIAVMPLTVLSQASSYTIQTNGVKDLAGNSLTGYSLAFSTDAIYDITAPNLVDVRCDDYMCKFSFDEQMKNGGASDLAWANSILNHANITLTSGGEDLVTASTGISWEAREKTAIVTGVNLTLGNSFTATIVTDAQDLSGNAINSTSSANVWSGTVESPGTMGGVAENIGGENIADEFGHKTADQFMSGDVNMSYPFNPMAGTDSMVHQTRVSFGTAIVDEDQIKLTFPTGTDVTNAVPDTFSPFYSDFNDFGSGTVTFDPDYDSDGVAVNANLRTVTVQLNVTGTPGANDFYTLDLRRIINPTVALDAGHGVKVQLIRAGVTKVTLDGDNMMKYYLVDGGTNTITLKAYASTAGAGEEGANGTFFMWGGGPGGPMDRELTLTDGITTAADGTAIAGDAGLVFSSLPDGCYNFGTEPFVTLGASNYFGRDMPEPVCVFGGESKTKNLVLTKAAAGNSATVTVKIVKETGFGGVDIDFFASGPGGFFVKTYDSVDTPNVNGYSVTLRSNGESSVGFGPAMSKGTSTSQPDFAAFGATPPPPVQLMVKGLGTESQAITVGGRGLPPGVTYDEATSTLTFTISDSDLEVIANVKDNSGNPISNSEVFMFSPLGGTYGQTDSSGNVTLNVSEYGPYEVGAWMHGLGETTRHIEVFENGVRMNGRTVETVNLVLAKPAYSISGKVLDASGSPIPYAPVWGTDTNGNSVRGGTDSSGIYTLFVSAGTWTLRSELPPDKTTECGAFTKTVVISNASKSLQNITPTAATCLTLGGTVTVDGSLQTSTFVFIEEWDTDNDRPAGGFHRGTNTDADGAYSVELPAGTYKVGALGTFGELAATTTVSSDGSTLNLDTGDLVDVTFSFTGGTSDMGGFIELKDANDRHTRIGTTFNDASNDVVVGVKSGTYNYFVDVFGAGQFSGTVVATSVNTVTLDTSSSALVTLSGTVRDSNSTALANVVVSANDSANNVRREAVTSSTGTYSLQVKAGDYSVNAGLAGYSSTPQLIVLSANTTLNLVMTAATKSITGTAYKADETIVNNGGRVKAVNSKREVVSNPINADGTWTLSVTDDASWQISAVAPLHANTALGYTVDTTDEVADTGIEITLVADATKTIKTASQSIAIASGGTVDDSDNSGMRVVAMAGALSANNLDATLSLERNYSGLLSDDSFTSADGNTYSVYAVDANNTQSKEPTRCIDITITYDPDDFPEGFNEADLKIKRESSESGGFVDCDCGFSIDIVRNTATCSTSHLSNFALGVETSALAPATPTGLAATAASATQINLSWTASDGATSYDIYRSTTVDGTFARLGSEPTVSSGATVAYADTGLTESTTYYYKISALNASGESASSSAANDTTVAAVVAPSTPTGLAAAAASTTQINLTWTAVGTATSYTVYRSSTADGTYTSIATPTSASSSDTGLSASTTYYYKVSASNGAGESAQSSAVSGTTSAVAVTPSGGGVILGGGSSRNNDEEDSDDEDGAGDSDDDGAGDSDDADSANDGADDDGSGQVPGSVVAPAPVVSEHWAEDFVKDLYSRSVLDATAKAQFLNAPNEYITRANFAEILVKTFGLEVPEDVEEAPFGDVSPHATYAPSVKAGADAGLIDGYADGTFKPKNYLTRAEALKFFLDGSDIDVSGVSYNAGFPDVVAGIWYADYVNYAAQEGIIGGYADGTFGPNSYLTRGEVAKIASLMKVKGIVGMIFELLGM